MRRFIALVLVGAFAVSACGSSASSQAISGSNATAPGSTQAADATATQAAATGGTVAGGSCPASGYTEGTYAGKVTHVFCGTAKATVIIDSITYKFTGECVYDASAGFALSAGTSVLGMDNLPADGPQFFDVVQLPGSSPMATGFMGGHSFVVSADVTVAADRKSGSASGVDATDNDLFTATFTC
jgi:hypothetical protein